MARLKGINRERAGGKVVAYWTLQAVVQNHAFSHVFVRGHGLGQKLRNIKNGDSKIILCWEDSPTSV
jgi:hypothetical protein